MVVRVASDPARLGQVLYRATALTLTGLAVVGRARRGLFNIAGEAQLAAGVLACAVVGAACPRARRGSSRFRCARSRRPRPGGAIGALIGAGRAYRGAHEVITSIMLNEIVAAVVVVGRQHVLVRERHDDRPADHRRRAACRSASPAARRTRRS